MGCLGDGGALITNNYELAQFARSIRDHGRGPGLEAINWGRNSRLDSLNARVIIERLKQLNNLIDKRRKLADIYFSHLKRLENNGILRLPPKYSTNSKNLSTFQNFEIRANHRDDLVNFLNKKNIGTIKQWGGFSIAHFSKLGYVLEDFPSVKDLFDKLLLLPLNHMMNEDQILYIAKVLMNFMKNSLESSYQLSKYIRLKALEMCSDGKSSHIASVLSCADILAVLYSKILKLNPDEPSFEKRD